MKAGALDFLTKPVKEKDLLEVISRAEAMDGSRKLHSELDRSGQKLRP